MRKFFNLALATAFICGASVFTACSSDDDNNSKKADEGGQNRKEFVEHTRANLKTLAENLNFARGRLPTPSIRNSTSMC